MSNDLDVSHRRGRRHRLGIGAALLASLMAGAALAEAPLPSPIPTTISSQAQAGLARLAQMRQHAPAMARPGPDDVAGWAPLQEHYLKMVAPMNRMVLEHLAYTQAARVIAGVPVLEVTPANWQDNGSILVYVHGGAYVFGSAASALPAAVLAANATRMRVVSIDYTLAPKGKWHAVTDQVVNVMRGLQGEGHPLRSMAIFGDSAGAGLAAGAVLKMRDQGFGMPAAAVLWSPWSDVSESGDTLATLKEVDFLSLKDLSASALAYAGAADQKNGYVSPVYGDYSKGFPPTLIQGGTREILLSGFIRHYQAIDSAGQIVKLDLYEGMPHVFQAILANTPESMLALAKMNRHLKQYLHVDAGS